MRKGLYRRSHRRLGSERWRTVTVNVTETEKEEIDELAERRGLSRSGLLKTLVAQEIKKDKESSRKMPAKGKEGS